MNFAASAGKPQDGSGTPLKAVQIDGQVRVATRPRCPLTPQGLHALKPAPRASERSRDRGVDPPPLEVVTIGSATAHTVTIA